MAIDRAAAAVDFIDQNEGGRCASERSGSAARPRWRDVQEGIGQPDRSASKKIYSLP